MPLSEDDVREILRLIDESDLDELRIETGDLSLHVVRRGAAAVPLQRSDAAEPPAPSSSTDSAVPIASPMLGTFYRAPAPGAPPFVDVGTAVAHDTVVCLIEVMKMMNPVSAGVAGTIVDVCADNAEVVEDGTVLFRVRPHGTPGSA
jgi:acetyl-CoA carboxylase biotin carboxyl carrier protein